MSLLDQIPEYKQAAEQERANRELAFCGLPIPVCGLLSNVLTPRLYVRLWGCENAFVCGRDPSSEDIAMFLWFISLDYSLDAGERHRFVKHRASKLHTAEAIRGIYGYLVMCFQDAPRGESDAEGMQKSYTSGIAAIVDILAGEYGWGDKDILDMPLPRIYQYLRRIQMRRRPDLPIINGSDAVIGKWLQERNTAQ